MTSIQFIVVRIDGTGLQPENKIYFKIQHKGHNFSCTVGTVLNSSNYLAGNNVSWFPVLNLHLAMWDGCYDHQELFILSFIFHTMAIKKIIAFSITHKFVL